MLASDSILSEAFWAFFQREKATNLVGVPFVIEMLDKIDFLARTYPSLRLIVVAGGKLSEDRQERFGQILMEKGIGFSILYGQVETTTALTLLLVNRITDKLGSVGVPIKGVSLSINEEGR